MKQQRLAPTGEYQKITTAYDFFNEQLFGSQLPDCMITLHRSPTAAGYFWESKFIERGGDRKTDEIALNPDSFKGRSDKEILSVLAHEMCHLWQSKYGKASRNGYHNKQWVAKMKEVGLLAVSQTSDNGTGQKVSHTIENSGHFDAACDLFVSRTGFTLQWESIPADEKRKGEKEKKRKSKTRYTCPSCQANAWAKPDACLICGDCMEAMVSEDEPDEGE